MLIFHLRCLLKDTAPETGSPGARYEGRGRFLTPAEHLHATPQVPRPWLNKRAGVAEPRGGLEQRQESSEPEQTSDLSLEVYSPA